MSMRIQLSRATVKDLHSGLQHAYRRDDVRLVRRITVLIDLLGHQVPVAVVCGRWDLRPSWFYFLQRGFFLRGLGWFLSPPCCGPRPEFDTQQNKTFGKAPRFRSA